MRSIVLAAMFLFLSAGYAGATDSTVKLDGYLEFRKGDYLIVDGQRVKASSTTKLTGAKNAAAISIGNAMKVKGTRDADGTVLATAIDTKANVVEGSEAKLLAGSNL